MFIMGLHEVTEVTLCVVLEVEATASAAIVYSILEVFKLILIFIFSWEASFLRGCRLTTK